MFKIDLNVKIGHAGYDTIYKCPLPIGMKEYQQAESNFKSSTNITNSNNQPSQQRPAVVTLSVSQQNAITAKRNKMAMTIATSPGQALLMNCLMLWFSGSQLNIFSITTTTSAITTPLTNILQIENSFRALQNDIDVQLPKLIYIALNLLWLCIGLYKMSSMRLLPTTSADFTYKILWKGMMEATSIPPTSSMEY